MSKWSIGFTMGLLACTSDPVDTDLPVETDVVDTQDSDTDGLQVDQFTFTAVAWNLESGGSEIETLADTVAVVEGEASWAFCEVQDYTWADSLGQDAADQESFLNFEYVFGTTGYEDRLVIAWDQEVFDKLDDYELDDINVGGTARAPLVVHFEVIATGDQFLFMVNHLWRSENEYRHEQADMLNEWVSEQTLPVIAMGDYNFDWDVVDGEEDHDEGYDLMTALDRWTWVRPDPLEETHCSSYNSVLDFAFVSPTVLDWAPVSEILTPDPDWCPDGPEQSDHRPVSIQVSIPQ